METILAQSTRSFYELQPILPLDQWWERLSLVSFLAITVLYVAWMYRRDTRQLPTGLAVLLTSLRGLAFGAILLFVLNPELRSELVIEKNSRLAVLVDTSLSMGLCDNASGDEPAERRIDTVAGFLKTSPFLSQMRRKHDITIYRFDEQTRPEAIATLDKISNAMEANHLTPAFLSDQRSENRSRQFGYLALGLAGLSLAILTGWIASIRFADRRDPAWLLAGGVLVAVVALIAVAGSDLATSNDELLVSLGWKSRAPSTNVERELPAEKVLTDSESQSQIQNLDWSADFQPRGTSTRLTEALQNLVNNERGGPIAGIIVITDGQNNSAAPVSRAIAMAENAAIPIFPVGIGDMAMPKNVQVVDVQAPPRVFPGDKFQVRCLLQAFGLEGQSASVQLLSTDEKETEPETLEDETNLHLAADGQTTSIHFDVSRQQQGKRRYKVRVRPVTGETQQLDNQRSSIVEIIDRKTVVLLMSGGPTREFRFLRNQLYRDKDVTLHVLLQSAREGADQESDELLMEFPHTREAMYRYDCLIAIDPDWGKLSDEQTALLEKWVAEKAGGLLLIAGPVNTPEWTRRNRGDQSIDRIRRLYPVSFYSQGSAALKLGRFGGELPFPLAFSREGRTAEQLWLGDTAADSGERWARFDGVFGYYAVNQPKSGADVLANFADPSTSVDGKLPIYLASQFYGAGRVFFQASGEMWRLRRLDVQYFEQYYTKLIRWISQGRLLRDSNRGVLLTDRQRCWVGDQVVVEAILRDAQDDPLLLLEVQATMIRPDGGSETMLLRGTKDSVRLGTYVGQFTASSEGDYRINLPVPNNPDLEVLTAEVQANIPELEKQRPQRNDALLSEIAEKTLGHYYVGIDWLGVDPSDPHSPASLVPVQDHVTFLPGSPDRAFHRKLMIWLLLLFTFVLGLEWTLRRLHKLA